MCGFIAAPLVAMMLSACSTVPRSLTQGAGLYWQQRSDKLPAAADVAAIPYPQLYVRTNRGHAVLVLGNVDGDRQIWYGKGGVVIFIEHGQVVKTVGFKQNLAGMQQSADNPFARGLQHLDAPITYRRTQDWSPGYRYGVPVTSTFTRNGEPTDLSILDHSHRVVQVMEQVTATDMGFHATNRYWVDTVSGLVWKSEQQIAPGETLTLIELKPYRKAAP